MTPQEGNDRMLPRQADGFDPRFPSYPTEVGETHNAKDRNAMAYDVTGFGSQPTKLKPQHLHDTGKDSITLTIVDWTTKTYDAREPGKEPDVKLQLFFAQSELPDLPLELNKTNVDIMIEAYGGDADEWLGKQVRLSCRVVTNPANGKPMDSLILSKPPTARPARPAASPARQAVAAASGRRANTAVADPDDDVSDLGPNPFADE